MICGICGKRLRSAKSKELGYGPVCYKKVFGAAPKSRPPAGKLAEENSDSSDYMIPGQMEISDFLMD